MPRLRPEFSPPVSKKNKMPLFLEKIVVKGNLGELKFDRGFKFQIDNLNFELEGFSLKKNRNDRFEFISNDTVYKVPIEKLSRGDEIRIFADDNKMKSEKAILIERDFLRQKEGNFKNLKVENTENNPRFLSINCKIKFNKKEMDWILIGSCPIEMEDRIVMYSKDDRILIYASWTGALYYDAKYKKIGDDEFLIYTLKAVKRKVEFSQRDFISDFKSKLEGHLNHRNWINKWSKEFFENN